MIQTNSIGRIATSAASLDRIVLTPATAAIAAGGSQSYTAEGYDAYGNDLGDVTSDTSFSIAPDGSCSGSSCTATIDGAHTVTGTDGGITGTASLKVNGSNVLSGVSCTSASFCMAVGDYVDSSGVTQTLAEKWNGTTWSLVTSPNSSSTQANVLSGARCTSSTVCFAVGDYVNAAGHAQTLIEKWNGATWTRMTSPNNAAPCQRTQRRELYERHLLLCGW